MLWKGVVVNDVKRRLPEKFIYQTLPQIYVALDRKSFRGRVAQQNPQTQLNGCSIMYVF